MLSTTAEYALRIMIVLAESEKEPTTSERIATLTKVPTDYSVKVLQMLARAGLVRAQRGRGGGFQIDCDPDSTTLLDVVNAIDPLERITSCPASRDTHVGQLCPLHARLDEIIVLLQDSFRKMTLASVIEGSPGPALCRPDLTSDGQPAARHAPATTPAPATSDGAGAG
ncbi:MAG: Rrf2 family transcriptional regulator [Planctomycetota bacterium]|nr:Rrf2 family transcriptional regulator [Planctomycetota bacterium]